MPTTYYQACFPPEFVDLRFACLHCQLALAFRLHHSVLLLSYLLALVFAATSRRRFIVFALESLSFNGNCPTRFHPCIASLLAQCASLLVLLPGDMDDSKYHESTCSCSNCYSRKTLPAMFIVVLDFFVAVAALAGVVLCTHFHLAVLGPSSSEYCPHAITTDIMSQILIICAFLAAAIFLFVGLLFRFSWAMGMHILKDGLFLIVSFILLIVKTVTTARAGTVTLYDGAVLASIAIFALLHGWFIFVMVSVGNYLSTSASRDRTYAVVEDIEKHDSDVYL